MRDLPAYLSPDQAVLSSLAMVGLALAVGAEIVVLEFGGVHDYAWAVRCLERHVRGSDSVGHAAVEAASACRGNIAAADDMASGPGYMELHMEYSHSHEAPLGAAAVSPSLPRIALSRECVARCESYMALYAFATSTRDYWEELVSHAFPFRA